MRVRMELAKGKYRSDQLHKGIMQKQNEVIPFIYTWYKQSPLLQKLIAIAINKSTKGDVRCSEKTSFCL